MQCLEPQCVRNKDIFSWIKQSFELLNRRIFANLFAVSFFLAILFFSSQAMVASQHLSSPVFLLMAFLIFSAFVFYMCIAGLVMISHYSDHSHVISFSSIVQSFIPSQKMLLKLSIIGVGVGLFFWYSTILMNPGASVISSSENLIGLLAKENLAIFYTLKTAAVFLFFVVLAMISLRTFFSLPLILFHGLSYSEAQNLSHKGIMKNVKVMCNVLMLWTVLIMLIMNAVPILALFILPFFACFMYVAYRHIYLGEGLNEKVKQRREVVSFSGV